MNTDSNDGLHQLPSSSGVMNDFIIISDKPISEELVVEIGMPEPTSEQKAIKLKIPRRDYEVTKKTYKAAGVPAKNNEGTEISNTDNNR